MKIKTIIEKLDKSESNSDWIDVESFGCELDIHNLYLADVNKVRGRLKCYWVAKHYCRDSYVGYRAYFLDDVLVCTSYQAARKSDELFYWVSKQEHKRVKDFLLSTVEEDISIEIFDLDYDIGDYYQIDCAGDFLRKDVVWNGDKVKIIKQEFWRKGDRVNEVTILTSEGKEVIVSPDEIQTPWNIIE